MARQRLGVVLLVPQPLATQIDGIRRGLGDGALARIPPHVTLVSPVNVAERDLSTAFSTVRRAAAATPPLTLRLGPLTTFQPVNPVAYLAVGGQPDVMDALGTLRAACLAGPLDRPQHRDYVPHVTVADEQSPARLDAAVVALADFAAEVTFDRVHVLAEQPGRAWVPIAEMALGEGPETVGRGSLPLDLAVTGRQDVEAAALLAVEQPHAGLPFAVTARREGAVVGAAWGWSAGGCLEVADLVVAAAHRGQGIGRHLLVAVEGVARRRSCTRASTAAPAGGAAASLLTGCGWTIVPSPDAPTAEHRRWERALSHDATSPSSSASASPQPSPSPPSPGPSWPPPSGSSSPDTSS
jgi:2'-5' RNA ligase/GNAT superfamily N-acetyltransferase